jgi:hypothetical protein
MSRYTYICINANSREDEPEVLTGCNLLLIAGALKVLILLSVSVGRKESSIWQLRGRTIVGDGEHDEFGSSAALSADARIMVIGAPGNIHDPSDLKKG